MISRNDLKVVEILLESGARTATKYLSARQIVRATRRTYRRGGGNGRTEILLTIGAPNYKERDFIKQCRAAGEVFPVKKVQLKFPSAKKGK